MKLDLKCSDLITVYPGRFQPFCLHHYNVYTHLYNEFNQYGKVVVTSSNKIDSHSPLSYELKTEIFNKYRIKFYSNILSPYNAIEILDKQFCNVKDTAIIFAIGEKDRTRLNPKYFTQISENDTLYAYDFNNKKYIYYYVIPDIYVNANNQKLSGTLARKLLSENYSTDTHLSVFGFYDEKIFNNLKQIQWVV